MAERFEIDIVSSTGDTVKSDDQIAREEEQQRERRERAARRRRAEQRAERASERADASAKRAEQREYDRIRDRAARERRRQERERQRAEKEIANEQKKRELERLRGERSLLSEEKKGHTLRRRFINDMLGALNQAHMGRRINHAIDFIQAIIGGGSSKPALATPGGPSFNPTANQGTQNSQFFDQYGQPKSPSQVFSNQDNNDLDEIVDAELVGNTIANKLREFFRSGEGEGQGQGSTFSNVINSILGKHVENTEEIIEDVELVPPDTPINIPYPELHEGLLRQFANAGKTAGNAARGSRFAQNATSAASAARPFGPIKAPPVVNPGFAAGAGAAAGAAGRGAGAGAGAAGAAGTTGGSSLGALLVNPYVAVIAALVVATGAGVVAFHYMTKAADKFADSLNDIPSDLIFAKLQNNLDMLNKKFERAAEFGEVLSDIELEKGKRDIMLADMFDSIMAPILPVVAEGSRLLTNIFEMMTPIVEAVSALTLEPIMKILERGLWMINKIIDLSQASLDAMLGAIESISIIGPWLAKAIRKFLKDTDKGADVDIMRNLLQFMNMDPVPAGQKKAPKFEFNIDINNP
jgi:hypothetical protein